MTRQDGRWTFRFPEVNGDRGAFEIAPRDMTFKQERRSYDFVRAEFSEEVGEMMEPHTEAGNAGGQLREGQPVKVRYDGNTVSTLYFEPDYVKYADDATYIELHDLQESMDTGIVDKHWDNVELRKAYEYAFSKRNNNVITDIKFTTPEEVERQIIGQGEIGYGEVASVLNDLGFEQGNGLFPWLNESSAFFNDEVDAIEQDATKELVDSIYAIDLDNISPAKAIWKMNKQFGLDTWVDNNRTLWVGTRESNAVQHIAAPDDSRVWRFHGNEVQVSHPRDPIFAVIVEGRWMDEQGIGGADDIIEWFDKSEDSSRGFGDYRAQGEAVRTEVDPENGQIIKKKDTDAKKESLDKLAYFHLRQESKKQNSGSVDIIPELSGELVSSPVDLEVGDFLHLVPNDDYFYGPTATSGSIASEEPDIEPPFGRHVKNEVYIVNAVTHEVSDGDWKVNAEITMFGDLEVKSRLRFFDPRSGEYVTEEDLYLDKESSFMELLPEGAQPNPSSDS
jgi:hypothetical protein